MSGSYAVNLGATLESSLVTKGHLYILLSVSGFQEFFQPGARCRRAGCPPKQSNAAEENS